MTGEAIRQIAERAIADRLGSPMPDAVLSVTRAPDGGAVILHVNSGGNALACVFALRREGYEAKPLPKGGIYGARLRVEATS